MKEGPSEQDGAQWKRGLEKRTGQIVQDLARVWRFILCCCTLQSSGISLNTKFVFKSSLFFV